MNFFGNSLGNDRSYIRSSIPLIALIWVQTWVCVATLIYAARTDQIFHTFYNSTRLLGAMGVIATLAPVSMLFVFADFSLGYLTGYYFYTMILGYLWFNYFTDFNYPHEIAGFSAATLAFGFLLPALFVRFPIRQIYQISLINFDRILNSFLPISAAILLIASSYNFRIVSLSNIYDFRSNLHVPTIVNYMVGTSSNALLPFTFACLFFAKELLESNLSAGSAGTLLSDHIDETGVLHTCTNATCCIVIKYLRMQDHYSDDATDAYACRIDRCFSFSKGNG